MKLRKWYWIVLAVWSVTGLPIYALSRSMFGESVFDVIGLVRDINVPTGSVDAFITWFISAFLIFFPILLLPFAFRVNRRKD